MQKDILHMTDEERWDRVGELLFKGAYLLALKEKEQTETIERPISLPEAAKALRLSYRTLQRWVAQGRIPVQRKPNGHIFILPKDLETIRSTRLRQTVAV